MINQSELIQSDFEAWYRQYPRKVGKLKAEKIYTTIVKAKNATPEELLAGAGRYATERAGQDPTYTRHPTTWLNAGGWLDEPKTQSKFVKPNRADSAIAGMRGYLEEGSHE